MSESRRSAPHRPIPLSPSVNPGAPRLERENVEFPDISWTAFDRYARYAAIARAITANLGQGPQRALDVGDNSGYLRAFAPDLRVTSVDVEVNPSPLAGTSLVLGDGSRLPVASRSVDVVISCDALEHVAPAHRSAFIAELARCSRDLIVIAAPFDTPGVAGSEELVRRFVRAMTGAVQPQLAEHAENGLPSLGGTRAAMEEAGLTVTSIGNGNLQDWVLGMLVKHQVVGRGGFSDLDMGFDIFYNLALQDRTQVGPYYRYLLIGRRSHDPLTGDPGLPAEPGLDAVPLLSAILATAPGLTGVLAAAAAIEEQQSAAFAHLMRRTEGLEGALQHLMLRFDGTDAALGALLSRPPDRPEDGAPPAGRSWRLRSVLRRVRRLSSNLNGAAPPPPPTPSSSPPES
ncbi:MAG: class I SAM-dependent methyltransferase [Acidimicrobiales bacterium]